MKQNKLKAMHAQFAFSYLPMRLRWYVPHTAHDCVPARLPNNIADIFTPRKVFKENEK